MSITRQTILASRPAAMVLALTLVAALTAPAVMLSRAHADPSSPTLPCAEINNNGCTELSATPPQDTQAVPPNIVLMLDDSGSMAWDYMPDWGYLARNSTQGARDWSNNSLYYNPNYNFTGDSATAGYQPPPQADGTSFPSPSACSGHATALTCAYNDGFTDHTAKNLTNYTSSNFGGTNIAYSTAFSTSTTNDVGPATPYCAGGYHDDGTKCVPNSETAPTHAKTWQCPSPPGGSLDTTTTPYTCYKLVGEGKMVLGNAVLQCPAGYTWDAGRNTCVGPLPTPVAYSWKCPNPPGGSPNAAHRCIITTTTTVRVFTIDVPQFNPKTGAFKSYLDYYIAGGSDCSNIPNANQNRCVNEDDTTGQFPDGTVSGPPGVMVGQNIANWFSYYRTRMLMSKTGLMFAFSNANGKYRFGFGSINGTGVGNIPASPTPYSFDDSFSYTGSDGIAYAGGSNSNLLAAVKPFGDGSSGTQKALFWNWIKNESPAAYPNNGTPLRMALNYVGQYYQTAQPWTTMSSDPGYTDGSTTKFACRASYTILTTDGFWNGADPTTPSGIVGAAGTNGPVNSVPSTDTTTQYLAAPPFSGGGVGSSAPSLADIATYYWETDLQPGVDWPNEVATSTADPAAWQHMTTFTIGLGFKPVGMSGTFTHPDTPVQDVLTWARGGAAISGFSWPTPAANSIYNIADLGHAAVNGHGDFFNVTKPEELQTALAKAFSDIASRTDVSPSAAVNASVLSLGALSFSTSYSTGDWSGTFQAVTLNADGTAGTTEWDAGATLNSSYHSADTYSTRKVWTDAYDPTATPAFTVFQFSAGNKASFDSTEIAGLGGNTDCTASGDTVCNRINYLLGDPTYEGESSLYRARTSGILGAIIRSQPVYVAQPTANYYSWPSGSPEATAAAASSGHDDKSYDAFMADHADRAGTVYVGANDGMLHAFDAPVPTCTYSGTPPTASCDYNPDGTAGNERWAFIPRAVYANLGNLTDLDFHFLPTVNESPVTRDVFFSGDGKWHTMLAGGVGLGGRGVYALDITDPTSFSASNVLWEFDSDSSVAGCTSIVGTTGVSGSCKASDLGYTISQPNIGRINYGNKWVVLVPNGYFPDCTTPDIPTATIASCQTMAKDAPKVDPSDPSSAPYSALFVLDAQTGSVIAELKTPNISGVNSFGLSTPVMGDYLGNQIDTVAFAGDVEGNLWRFDFGSATVSDWTVTLVYQAPVQGAQPITTMPRLFPDPTTNRMMVVFGTGKFLGVGDNSDDTVQAIYGVRDPGKCSTDSGCAVTGLTQQFLHEETPTSGPYTGLNLRCVTGSADDTSCTSSPSAIKDVPASSGGWYINLNTTTSDGTVNDAGERVVATPAAIFSSNTVVIETLITGAQNTNACDPSTQGSILFLNVLSGGTAGASSLGGGAMTGARISNALTSGSLPILSQVGGAKNYAPGTCLLGSAKCTPVQGDQPWYRRRSWNEINQDQ